MVYCLLVESTMKAQCFHAKLLFQKAMLRQGGAQNVLSHQERRFTSNCFTFLKT